MIFTTHWFLLFAGMSVGVFWLLPKGSVRTWFLAAACVYFHAHFAGPAGVLPIVVLMTITYLAAFSRRPAVCVAAIVLCVAALCFYKYILFLIGAAVEPWNSALAKTLSTSTRAVMPGAPPLAVSFFTFEFVHYLYDVRKGTEPIRSPLKFLLFAIFFPSLVAGPIKRYEQFIPELERAVVSRPTWEAFSEGLRRIALGFAKKVLLADTLTFYIDRTQGHLADLSLPLRWAFAAALALRILFDFSGYSDVAIGCARLLGISLPENFNWPYLSRNLQEFWQRWHISLSSWIRDYVYIPLGGSRRGPARRFVNALFAFALCGLWHGAAWNFVLWGLFHGCGLAVCLVYEKVPGLGPAVARLFTKEPFAAWAATQIYVGIGWLLFFYPVPEAFQMIKWVVGLA